MGGQNAKIQGNTSQERRWANTVGSSNGRLIKLPVRQSDREFMDKLNKLRKDGEFCDVQIKVRNRAFPAHKVVIAAFSETFKEYLAESKSSEVELKENLVPDEVFEIALNYAYGESSTFPDDNRLDLLMLIAHNMKARSLVEACGRLMASIIDDERCFQFYNIASKCEDATGKQAALLYIRGNFQSLCNRDEFLEVSPEGLKELIGDGFLERNQSLVSRAVDRWVAHRKSQNQSNAQSSPARTTSSSGDDSDSDKEDGVKKLLLLLKLLEAVSSGNSKPDGETTEEYVPIVQSTPEVNAQGVLMISKVSETQSVTAFLSIQKEKLYILQPPPFQLRSLRDGCCGNGIAFTESRDSPTALRTDFWCYKASSNQWSILPKGGPTIPSEGLALLGQHLYVFGADMENKTFWRYDPAKRSWDSLAALTKGVCGAEIVTLHGMIYILGRPGTDSNAHILQRYDPHNGVTKVLDAFPARRERLIACAFQDNIFVVDGGGSKSGEPADPDVVYMYKTSTERWERGPSLERMPNRPDTMVVLNGSLTLVGIANSTTVICQQYVPSTNSWNLIRKEISVRPLTATRAFRANGFVFTNNTT